MALLKYSRVILRTSSISSSSLETEALIDNPPSMSAAFDDYSGPDTSTTATATDTTTCSNQEFSIKIVGAGGVSAEQVAAPAAEMAFGCGEIEGVSMSSTMQACKSGSESAQGEFGSWDAVNNSDINWDTSHQRFDVEQYFAPWIEQIPPFSLLLLVVFIRHHSLGFFVTIWITTVFFKSNDILRKQTALKGERKISILIGITVIFILHVVCVYWWYHKDDLLYPLALLPAKAVPPFQHAIFVIMVNDIMVKQVAMVFKCILLLYYKKTRGRKQGQMLTLVEYMLLLYRALLPTPVWYRFFLNKQYGNLFPLLTTGLYFIFKLSSVVEKVQFFLAALRALSRKEVNYGSYATSEQVNATGDLCAICQEKMHAPILLHCKHIFCEDCVSEWFERERTCPLCRDLVKPEDIKSYGDGSTTLTFQLF